MSAYAPTMTNPDEVKDKFYDDLDSVISAATGHINSSSLGTSMPEWEGVIGTEGVGKWNSNGLL